MGISRRCSQPSPWGAHDEPFLQQERFIDVLDRLGLFSDADRKSRKTDRSSGEAHAQRLEDHPVDAVEPELVDPEDSQTLARRLLR